MFQHSYRSLAAALVLASTSVAQDYTGLDVNNSQIYDVDTATNAATLRGAITGAPRFGFSNFAPIPGGGWYGVAPGAFSGYSIYRIGGQTLQATLLYTPAGASMTGGVGCALSAYGDKLYVAGFVGFSFRVILEEVDLTTGTLRSFGDIPAGWGLAFDSLGNLYTSVQGATWPELVRIDLANPLASVNVGPMTGVDMSFGIDLSSDSGSGDVHAWATSSKSIYTIDTTNANATLLSALTGANSLQTVKEVACDSVFLYGTGCGGTGGFTPSFTIRGCAKIGNTIALQLQQALGGAPAAIVYGTGQIPTPLGFGCNLLVSSLLPLSTGFTASLGGPGAGSASFSVVIPWMPAGDVTMQIIVLDGGSLPGFTVSNGVLLRF